MNKREKLKVRLYLYLSSFGDKFSLSKEVLTVPKPAHCLIIRSVGARRVVQIKGGVSVDGSREGSFRKK